MEGAFLKVEATARSPREGVHRMVAVLRAEAVKQHAALVGPVIAVGITQEDERRLLRHVDAAVAQFESHWHVQVVGKDGRLVGASVAVEVLENHQLVVGFFARERVRVRGRREHPQSSPGVEGHRQGLANLRKLLLRGEQIHLIPWRDAYPLERDARIARRQVHDAAAIGLEAFLGRDWRDGDKQRDGHGHYSRG